MMEPYEEAVEPDEGTPQPNPYKDGEVQQDDPDLEPEES